MQVVAQEAQAASGKSDGRQQLTALIAACGLYRPGRAVFSLTGRDRVRWLNGMVSNNVRDLAPGNGVYAFVLNPQGNILGDLYIFNRGESLVIEIEAPQAEALVQILRRYIIMDKVEIEDLREETAVIAVAGPKSPDVLSAFGLNANLETLQLQDAQFNDSAIRLVRGDNPCVPNYEFWVPSNKAESLWNALLQAGAVAVDEEAVETFRILCGIPKVGQDIRERTLPQETGQDRALNFNKGCYIGQEIVERIRARGAVHRTFVGFEVNGPAPTAATKIQSDGKDVGELTSIMAAPLKGKQLALGYLRKEFNSPEKKLTAGLASVKPAQLPFTELLKNR